MKRSNFGLFAVLLFMYSFVLSCKNDVQKLPDSGLFRADVVTLDSGSVQTPSDVPKFIYGTQTFPRLTDINNLSGPRLKVLQGGDLEIQETAGSVITSSQFSGYTTPNLEYRVVEGVVKPLNNKSLTLLSAGFQFDTLINKIEALTGLREDEFFQGFQEFNIIYHPAVKLQISDEQIRKYETTNAAYIAGVKQFALFTSGKDERVPMAFNPQIISHEFGHAIFEKTFFDNKYERCAIGTYKEQKIFPGRLESEFVIRGINEGFADFVSFVWTGSSNILQASLGDSVNTRERDFSSADFDYRDFSFEGTDVCRGRFYCIGTLWAKTLFEVYKSRSLDPKNVDARQAYLREIVGVLTMVGETLRAFDGDRLPVPDDMASRCQTRDYLSPSYDEDVLAAFFEAFIDNVDSAQRKNYCDAIAKHFDTSAFPNSSRGSCK